MWRWLICLVLLITASPGAEEAEADPRAVQIQQALGSLSGLYDPRSQELRNLYQEAQSELLAIEKANSEAGRWREILDNTSEVIGSLEAQVAAFQPTPLPRLIPLTLEQLKQLQNKLQPQLLNLEGELNALEALPAKLGARNQQLPELAAALRTRQQQISLEPPAAEDKRLQQALQLKAELQTEALSAQLEALQLEQLVTPIRQQEAELRGQLHRLQITDLRSQLAQIREAIYQERQIQARQALSELRELKQLLAGRAELLQAQAQVNEQLIQELDQLTRQQDELGNRNNQVKEQEKQMINRTRMIQTQQMWLSRSPKFGAVLRVRLEELPALPSQSTLNDAIASRHIQCFEYRLKREAIQPIEATYQRVLDQADVNLSRVDKEILNELLTQRMKLLFDIEARCENLIRLESAILVSYQQLDASIATLRHTIREQLLWVPSIPPVDRQFFDTLQKDWRVFTRHVVNTPWQAMTTLPYRQVIGLLFFLLLIAKLWERWEWTKIRTRYASRIGHVTKDSFLLTLKLLIGDALLALPLPLLVFGISWWLAHPSEAPLFSDLARALKVTSIYLIPFVLLAKWAAPNGLLIAHLGLKPANVKLVRRATGQLGLLGGLALFMVILSYQQSDLLIPDNLGRSAFVLLTLLFSYWELLALSRSPLKLVPRHPLQAWIIAILLTLFTLLLTTLAIRGYIFAATQLGMLAIISLGAWAGMRVAYLLILRFLLIQERRLAYQRAKARRDERKEQRQDGDADSMRPQSEAERITVEQLSNQSLSLLQPLLILGFALLLVSIWTDALDIEDLLSEIILWHQLDSQGQATAVTLENLVIGLVLLGLTLIASRNLPALLELSVLPRFNLLPGTGYALMTLLRYTLILLGTIFTFTLLGFQWNKLQWLVAAVGVGLGFGLQEIFGNLVSGLIILFEKPIRIGDIVTVQDVTGSITRIKIRATTIQDYDRREVILPNKIFITEKLINWSLSDAIGRVVIPLSFEHTTDPALVEKALHSAIAKTPMILDPPEPRVLFLGINQQAMEFKIYCFVEDVSQSLSVKHQLYHGIHQALADHDLTIARPKMDLQVLDADGSGQT